MKNSDRVGLWHSTGRGMGTSVPDVLPISQAVVIGLGGTGIQTISRVKSMVEGNFPEASATSSLVFLGVDAVTQDSQEPPLPKGIRLDDSEFFNLTEELFEPSLLVKQEASYESHLHRWYDFSKRLPVGPLGDGLKQDRMLGRLAYYRVGKRLEDRIETAFRKASGITADGVHSGSVGKVSGGFRPRVFLVSSMCGGTGSSGFLDVVYRVWKASMQFGVSPEIKAFLYMPGIFEEETARKSVNPFAEKLNLRANGYAFLRELDHFISNSDDLWKNVAVPDDEFPVTIPEENLLKQVFLVDSQLTSGMFVNEITDTYEVTASAIYQLLMTHIGKQMTVSGTNVDRLLLEKDGHGKRRIYCGLGVASITYPGDTLRRNLIYRFADWMVRNRLMEGFRNIAGSAELAERVRQHTEPQKLVKTLTNLHTEATEFVEDDDISAYRKLFETATDQLAADNSDEAVTRIVGTAKNGRARVVNIYRRQFDGHNARVIGKLMDVVVDEALRIGESVPFLTEMMDYSIAQLEVKREEARASFTKYQGAIKQREEEVDEAEMSLSGATGFRRWLGRRDAAAKELGQAIKAYGNATLESVKAEASESFFSGAIQILQRLHRELGRAEQALNDEALQLSEEWHSDELIGKDAGPRSLTVFIPSDILPEVEDSGFAKQAFARVRSEVEQIPSETLLKDLYRNWTESKRGRGPFDLGSSNGDQALSSRSALVEQLGELARRYALQVGMQEETVAGESTADDLYLPRSLRDAANRMDQGDSLDRGLFTAKALSGQVLLPVSTEKMRTEVAPTSTTMVSCPKSLRERVNKQFPNVDRTGVYEWADEERIQLFVTQWGASAHAINSVSTWKAAYEDSIRSGADEQRLNPHISRKWADELDPLEPSYEDRGMAADSVVQALLTGRLLKDQDVREMVFGNDLYDAENWSALEQISSADRTAWRGTTFVYISETRKWIAKTSRYDFGTTLDELLGQVSGNAPFRQSTTDVFTAVVELAGRVAVKRELADLLIKFVEAIESSSDEQQETDAAKTLHRAAQSMKRRFEQSSIVADF